MSGVHVYIDGYNFYCGINKPGWLKYGWCNFSKLATHLAGRAFGSSFGVDEVKYYTAPVRMGQENKHGESERQQMWLDAIRTETPEVKIIEGRWKKIGNEPREEKETDVNIAVDMQWDTVKSERIILVSGDSDFIPAIRGVRKHAERNAIYLAARRGISTEGCAMFVELTPCVDCARAIIQAGIVEVVINRDRASEYSDQRYSDEHSTALEMLAEAGVTVRFVSPKLSERKPEEA
jgi:deoxycytidylate deaminase